MLHLKETTKELARSKKQFVGRCWATIIILWCTAGALVGGILGIVHNPHHTEGGVILFVTGIIALSLVCLMATWVPKSFD